MTPQREKSIYEGLLVLLEEEYPKTCTKCGRTYPDIRTFLDATTTIEAGSGLMSYDSDPTHEQVAVFRNCPCGSTLATFCSDRRDTSAKGARRREIFRKIHHDLLERGISPANARGELIAFLRGQPSPLLADLGVDPLR